MGRRISMLCCLLITAALLYSLPTLLGTLSAQDGERMAERLQPKKAHTLTIWILSDATDSRKHLSEQIALFEKQRADVRVYLRWADSAELFAENAVLPDVVLFSPGALTDPARALHPLLGLGEIDGLPEDALRAGYSAGLQYGTPLWFAPSVLAVPAAFFPTEAVPTPAPTATSFFDLGSPAPTVAPSGDRSAQALPDASLIPWQRLLEPGALAAPKGMALIQLLSMCPTQMRPALIASLTGQSLPATDTAPRPSPAFAPKSATSPPPEAGVMILAAYQNAMASGKPLAGFALTPACTENVLLLGICNDHTLSRALLSHLLSKEAQAALTAHALLPVVRTPVSGDAMTLSLVDAYHNGLLFPNAFEHTAQELSALCLDAFWRNQEPVETLLRLR